MCILKIFGASAERVQKGKETVVAGSWKIPCNLMLSMMHFECVAAAKLLWCNVRWLCSRCIVLREIGCCKCDQARSMCVINYSVTILSCVSPRNGGAKATLRSPPLTVEGYTLKGLRSQGQPCAASSTAAADTSPFRYFRTVVL